MKLTKTPALVARPPQARGGDRRPPSSSSASAAAIAYNALKRPDDVDRGKEVAFKRRAAEAGRQDHQLADVRLRPRPHPLPAREQGQAAVQAAWKYGDRPLLEFPPIFVRRELCDRKTKLGCSGRLFFVNNNGHAFSLDADTGKIIWQRDIAELNASSPPTPAAASSSSTSPRASPRLDAKTGKTIWKRSLPGRSESSPVVVGNKVFFGCENGELFALNAKTGKTKWSTPTGGAIKAAPAYEDGILYVGDYGGRCRRSRRRTARSSGRPAPRARLRRRRAPSTRPRRSPSAASTAATTTAASTASTPRPASWPGPTRPAATSTRAPRWPNTKDTKPTVYIGSFDGNIYALNAKTGDARWVARRRAR